MSNPKWITFFILILAFQAGCSGEHIPELVTGSSSSSSSGLNYSSDPALEQQAINILRTNCSGCHGASPGSGGVFDILNVSHVIQMGLIVPGDPNAGRIIGAIGGGTMPPTGALAASDLQAIKDWVSSLNLSSGGGPVSPPPVLEPTFKSISENILQPKCVTCHRPSGAKPDILYDSYSSAIATGRIVAGNAAESEMYKKTNGGSMPPTSGGYAPLSVSELDIIRQWINAGALNN